MSLTTDSMSAADLAAVVGDNRNNGFGGFGGDGLYAIIVLFLIIGMMGNGFGGFGGMGGFGGGAFPWLLAGQTNQGNDVQRGFDQAAVTGAINAVGASVNALQPQLCNGFAGVNATINNGFANAEIAANARQMANMQQAFSAQMAQQQCCCENRAGLADVKYTIATENCADRAAISDALRDVIASNTANTQAILDKMCQQEIDALKTQNANLQTQINLASLNASQTAQTAVLMRDNAFQTSELLQRIVPYPIPAYTVPNPYGTTTTT